MVGCSTFEARCASAWVRQTTYLTTGSCIGSSSTRARVSSSVPVEPSSIKVHGNWDIVHTSWSISRIIRLRVIRPSLVELRGSVGVIPEGTIIGLESSSLEVIVTLETSKRSSSKTRMGNEGGSVALSSLVGLRTLSKDILQQLLGSSSLNGPFFECRVVDRLGCLQDIFKE